MSYVSYVKVVMLLLERNIVGCHGDSVGARIQVEYVIEERNYICYSMLYALMQNLLAHSIIAMDLIQSRINLFTCRMLAF